MTTTTFNFDKPIWRQIVDLMAGHILDGRWPEEERIPAVREFAMTLQVNPNTVMRACEYFQSREVLESRRGIGYFVAPGAAGRIRSEQREVFLTVELPEIRERMAMLGISLEEAMERMELLNRNDNENKH